MQSTTFSPVTPSKYHSQNTNTFTDARGLPCPSLYSSSQVYGGHGNPRLSSHDLSLCLYLGNIGLTLLGFRFRAVAVSDWCIYSVYLYLYTRPNFVPAFPTVNHEGFHVMAVVGLQGTGHTSLRIRLHSPRGRGSSP